MPIIKKGGKTIHLPYPKKPTLSDGVTPKPRPKPVPRRPKKGM